MFRSSLCALIGFIATLAVGLTTGCTPGPLDGDGGGNGAAAECRVHGDGCETDADCCEGLVCHEWTCEPTDDVPDGNGDGDGGGSDGDDGAPVEHPGGIVADHSAAAAFDSIPAAYTEIAKSDYRIFYGHTSHGSQLVTGMNMLDTGPGTLSIEENEDVDLGHEGDLGWVDVTRDVLDRPGSDINMIMWSWCGGVSDNTEEGIDAYLDAMNELEGDYPHVVFVYMTGHLDGTGPSGNLHIRNNQIRDYCTANEKILFDFADIESYDPDGNYYPDGSDWCEWCETWCDTHTCPDLDCVDDDDCQHSMCFNCYQKGRAFWWMMARIAGWSGSADDVGPPDDAGTPGNGDTPANGDTPHGDDEPAIGGRPAERLQPADLTYHGAFRLPENFNWGALGLSSYPDGDGGAGSLLVTEFEALSDPAHPGESCWDPTWNCYAYFGEVAIPTPARAANWEDLPEAILVAGPTAFDGGLALDPLTGYSRVMVSFFASHRYARLVVLTKAADVRNLMGVEHRGQVILSWSLNPPEVCGQFEINTPTPGERVEAMRQCATAGYPVRAVIMPIIPIAGWRDAYGAFLQELITTVSLARITLGGICSYDGALSLTQSKLGPGNTVSRRLHRSGCKSMDGRRRYVVSERIDMYRHLITAIRRLDPQLPIALCLEERAVFEAVGMMASAGRCNCVL